jgi:hypothetical protein
MSNAKIDSLVYADDQGNEIPVPMHDIALIHAYPHDPLADFKKGIKRDQMLFHMFKEEKLWDSWQ